MSQGIRGAQLCAQILPAYSHDNNLDNLRNLAARHGEQLRNCGDAKLRSERIGEEWAALKSTVETHPEFRSLPSRRQEEVLADFRKSLESPAPRDDTTDWIAKGLLTVAMGIYFGAVAIGLSAFSLFPGNSFSPGGGESA